MGKGRNGEPVSAIVRSNTVVYCCSGWEMEVSSGSGLAAEYGNVRYAVARARGGVVPRPGITVMGAPGAVAAAVMPGVQLHPGPTTWR